MVLGCVPSYTLLVLKEHVCHHMLHQAVVWHAAELCQPQGDCLCAAEDCAGIQVTEHHHWQQGLVPAAQLLGLNSEWALTALMLHQAIPAPTLPPLQVCAGQ